MEDSELFRNYSILSNLWSSGIRDYHNLNLSYITANSILIAAIAVILRLYMVSAYIVSIVFSLLGIIICIQMSIALGRLRAQNAYWERNLRIIENDQNWKGCPLFKELYEFREKQKVLSSVGDEPEFKPNFAIRHHRDFWAPRIKVLPGIFAILYSILFLWSIWIWHPFN